MARHAKPSAAAQKLAQQLAEDGAQVLASYRDPVGDGWQVFALLPVDKVEPTPYQRDLSPTHVKRLHENIKRVGRFIDPIVAVAAGPEAGEVMSAIVSAPLVEEFFKCLGVWGVAFFLKREFDGVVDGIIYATFVALGFAAVENVIYYANAAQAGTDVLAMTFGLRGVLGPWAHPVYTCMFGIGMGISREGSLIDVGVEAGLIRKAGAWYTYAGDQLGQGKENARGFLKDNPDLANELEKKILEKLGVTPTVDGDFSDLSDEPIGVDSF